jgi:glycerol uptake facilitator-like aquaporin
MLSRLKVAALAAEFLGAGALALMALILTNAQTPSLYIVGTSLAILLGVCVFLFGTISGAHANPAVTFGMWTARLIGTYRAIAYIAVQLLGGLVAWQLYQYLSGSAVAVKHDAFSGPVWLAEVLGTFFLTMGIMAAISRGLDLLQSAFAYGGAFFVGILITSTASNSFINPAIALGLRNWNMAYVVGPLVGALLGVNLYMWLFEPAIEDRIKKHR